MGSAWKKNYTRLSIEDREMISRGHASLAEREMIKKQTIQNRRLIHQIKAA